MDINKLEFELVVDGQVVTRGNLQSIKAYITLIPEKPGSDVGVRCVTPLGSPAEAEMLRRVMKAQGVYPADPSAGKQD